MSHVGASMDRLGRRLLWFVAIWAASVAVLAVVAAILRLALRGA